MRVIDHSISKIPINKEKNGKRNLILKRKNMFVSKSENMSQSTTISSVVFIALFICFDVLF